MDRDVYGVVSVLVVPLEKYLLQPEHSVRNLAAILLVLKYPSGAGPYTGRSDRRIIQNRGPFHVLGTYAYVMRAIDGCDFRRRSPIETH